MTDAAPSSAALRAPGAGKTIKRRAAETVLWTLSGQGFSSIFRLASNLVLARLLMPEAFGIIAITFSIKTFLDLLTDVGLNQNAIQSQHGDDPVFLDTLWTLQIARGLVVATALCLVSSIFAFTSVTTLFAEGSAYRASQLPGLIALLALVSVMRGFAPTKAISAQRHMQFGRLTGIALASQVLSSCATIVAALAGAFVWSFAIGTIIGSFFGVMLKYLLIEGRLNRFAFNKTHAIQQFHFGKWIFVSTICGYLHNHSDKIILANALSASALGVYYIGLMLAKLPTQLGKKMMARTISPVLRERPPWKSTANFLSLRKLRFVFSFGLTSGLVVLSFLAPQLVSVLYDDRYQLASQIVIMACMANMPNVVTMSHDRIPIAAGDTRTFFNWVFVKTVVQLLCFIIALQYAGLFGAIISPGLSAILVYPMAAFIANKYKGWDILHDASVAVFAFICIALIAFYHAEA
ncbi:MAG: oligosaccharide flippase family protein, partial [Pseudomonadota bacterium]